MNKPVTDADLNSVIAALRALRAGNLDFSVPEGQANPLLSAIAREFNEHLRMIARFKSETMRVIGETGMVGRLGATVDVPAARGDWQTMVQHINTAVGNLTGQIRTTSAVVENLLNDGQPGARVTCDSVGGELQELREIVNALAGKLETSREPVGI